MQVGPQRAREFATRAVDVIKSGEYSAPQLAGLALGYVFEVVRTDVLVRDLSTLPRRPTTPPGFAVHPVGGDTWRDILPRARWRTVRPFLQRDDVGYVATVGGEFAGWVWVSRKSHRDPWSGLDIRLADDEAYAYSLAVVPKFRALGVSRPLMVTMLEEVSADPAVTRVYGWVDHRNRKSQMLLRLLGFVDAQTVWRVHVLHRVGGQLPRSATPAFGPLSRAGRHTSRSTTRPIAADDAMPIRGRVP